MYLSKLHEIHPQRLCIPKRHVLMMQHAKQAPAHQVPYASEPHSGKRLHVHLTTRMTRNIIVAALFTRHHSQNERANIESRPRSPSPFRSSRHLEHNLRRPRPLQRCCGQGSSTEFPTSYSAISVWFLELSSYARVKAFAFRAGTELHRIDVIGLNVGVAPELGGKLVAGDGGRWIGWDAAGDPAGGTGKQMGNDSVTEVD